MTDGEGGLWRKRADDSEPPFDPSSWHGALFVMIGAAALLWVIQIVNATGNYAFDRNVGLRPRELDGLWGVATQPFLHASYGHLLSNTAPFVLLGWVLLLSGVRTWLIVTGLVIGLGGLATWLVAPHGVIVGASSLIFGWLGYLLARAYFSRRLKWILTAVLVLFFFGTLLTSLLPSFNSNVSWQSHVCGFGAGIAAGAVLHPRPRAKADVQPSPGPVVS